MRRFFEEVAESQRAKLWLAGDGRLIDPFFSPRVDEFILLTRGVLLMLLFCAGGSPPARAQFDEGR